MIFTNKTTAAIFVFWLFFVSVCFAESGVAQRNILLGAHQPLSGPAQEFSAIGKSAQVYFQYVNDQGGVHGRAIELKIRDDKMQAETARKVMTELTLKNEVFAVFSGLGTQTHRAVYSLLKSQKIPSFFVGSDLREWTSPVRPDIFGFIPTAETEGRVLGQYLTQRYVGQNLIIWHSEQAVYQRAAQTLTDGLRGVSVKLLPGKPGRLAAEWQLIRKHRPDLLAALGSFGEVLDFLKTGEPLNIPVFTGYALADSRLAERLKRRTLNRLRVLTAYPLILEAEHPGVQFHQVLMREYAPLQVPNRWTLYGHAAAELMVEVLQRSGRALTRPKALSSAETVYRWQGKLMPPVYLNRRNHLALTSLRVSQILPERVIHLSEWINGFE